MIFSVKKLKIMRIGMQMIKKLCGLSVIVGAVAMMLHYARKLPVRSLLLTEDASGAPSPEVRELQDRLGLHEGWELYTPSKDAMLTEWKPVAIKVIFELVDPQGNLFYLVDVKRAGRKKDQRWEFPGGRLEQGEGVMAALVRELQEEDPSQTLSGILKRNIGRSAIVFKPLQLKKERECIFKTTISGDDWNTLHRYWQQGHPENEEVYNYALVPASDLDPRGGKLEGHWTPKSKKILKAIRKDR